MRPLGITPSAHPTKTGERSMRSMRPRLSAAAVALLAFFLAVGAVGRSVAAQVLDQVPADALAVLKFGKLEEVSKKIANHAEALGIAAFREELSDPLGAFLAQAEITEG